MTCIVAIETKDNIILAGDKLGSTDYYTEVYSRPKVFRNGDFLIGYTTSYHMGQLLEFEWKQPTKEEGISDDVYIYRDVRQSIKRMFECNDFGQAKAGDFNEPDLGNFIFIYKNKIYSYEPNSAILEHINVASCGSGSLVMKGAVYGYFYALDESDIFQWKKVLDTCFEITSSIIPSVSSEYDCFCINLETNECTFHEHKYD